MYVDNKHLHPKVFTWNLGKGSSGRIYSSELGYFGHGANLVNRDQKIILAG